MDMIEDTAYVGVSLKDRIVTFSKTRENISSSITITIPDKGYNEVYCLLTDMAAGKWKVTGNGSTLYVQSEADSNPADHYKDGGYAIDRRENSVLQKKEGAFSGGAWRKASFEPTDRQPLGKGTDPSDNR